MVDTISLTHSSIEARMPINSDIRLIARGICSADKDPLYNL
jgi:hypothetical protein